MRPGWPVLDLPDLLQHLAGGLVGVGQARVHSLGERLDGQVLGWPCWLLRFRLRPRLAPGCPARRNRLPRPAAGQLGDP